MLCLTVNRKYWGGHANRSHQPRNTQAILPQSWDGPLSPSGSKCPISFTILLRDVYRPFEAIQTNISPHVISVKFAPRTKEKKRFRYEVKNVAQMIKTYFVERVLILTCDHIIGQTVFNGLKILCYMLRGGGFCSKSPVNWMP